jgi:hypothetical protein
MGFSIGCLKIEKLKADEVIPPKISQPEPEEESKEDEEVKEDSEEKEAIPEEEEKQGESHIEQMIDEEIENDSSIPIKVPEKYVEAMHEIDEPIPKGASALPPMPALDGNPPVQADPGFSFQNVLLGLGGLLLGMRMFKSESANPIYL